LIELLLSIVLSALPQAHITGYTAKDDCPGLYCDGLTAMMEPPEVGVTLACPAEVPFGTPVWIEGVGVRICEDRGGLIRGMRFDVFVADSAAAYAITGLRRHLILTDG